MDRESIVYMAKLAEQTERYNKTFAETNKKVLFCILQRMVSHVQQCTSSQLTRSSPDGLNIYDTPDLMLIMTINMRYGHLNVESALLRIMVQDRYICINQ